MRLWIQSANTALMMRIVDTWIFYWWERWQTQ